MEYETKKKIKRFIRDKWKWLLGSGIFLIAGTVIMLVGFSMSGWSIVRWLQSPFAVTTIIFIVGGVFLLIMAFLIKKHIDIMK